MFPATVTEAACKFKFVNVLEQDDGEPKNDDELPVIAPASVTFNVVTLIVPFCVIELPPTLREFIVNVPAVTPPAAAIDIVVPLVVVGLRVTVPEADIVP